MPVCNARQMRSEINERLLERGYSLAYVNGLVDAEGLLLEKGVEKLQGYGWRLRLVQLCRRRDIMHASRPSWKRVTTYLSFLDPGNGKSRNNRPKRPPQQRRRLRICATRWGLLPAMHAVRPKRTACSATWPTPAANGAPPSTTTRRRSPTSPANYRTEITEKNVPPPRSAWVF